MWDLAEKKLDCQACYGLVKGIANWPEELKSPVWTTAAGLALYSAKLKLHRPQQRKAGGLLGLVTR
jgi:cell division protein FtsA